MIRSILSGPVRLIQHTALGAARVGVRAVVSTVVAVRVRTAGDAPAPEPSPRPTPNPAPPRVAAVADPVPAKKAPAKKAPAAKKTPAAKKAPAKKAPAAKKSVSAVPTPADVAARIADKPQPEHVDVEEVLAYSTGPDVTTTVADEVTGSTKS